MRACRIRIWIQMSFAVVVCVISSGTAGALETRAQDRVLAEHTFMPSKLLQQPFTTRSYAMAMGVGYAKADVAGVADLSVAAFGMNTRLQQPITESFGLRGGLTGSVLTGIDGTSALSVGAQGVFDLSGGAFFNVLKSDHFSVTVATDIGGGQRYAVSPLSAIQASINAGTVSTSGLLVRTTDIAWRLGGSGAAAISKYFGLFVDFAYRLDYSDPNNAASEESHFLEFGAGLSVNFIKARIPVGLTAAYQREQELASDKESTDSFEVGLYYAPNDHFTFGPSLQGSFYDSGTGVKTNSWSGFLGLTYYQ